MIEEDIFITEEDCVNDDLQNITLKQYAFNKWFEDLQKFGDRFTSGFHFIALPYKPVKLSWWKCWFWWAIPSFFLGVEYCILFKDWKIGHCLNCDANPYDGVVEAWSNNCMQQGALIRCGKCGQFRWQESACLF